MSSPTHVSDPENKGSRSPLSSPSSSSKPNKPAKKRTKTGCLTCRRRRIKCREEKPYCSNCIKSRRQCEYTKFQWRPPGPNTHSLSNSTAAEDTFLGPPLPLYMAQTPTLQLPYGAHGTAIPLPSPFPQNQELGILSPDSSSNMMPWTTSEHHWQQQQQQQQQPLPPPPGFHPQGRAFATSSNRFQAGPSALQLSSPGQRLQPHPRISFFSSSEVASHTSPVGSTTFAPTIASWAEPAHAPSLFDSSPGPVRVLEHRPLQAGSSFTGAAQSGSARSSFTNLAIHTSPNELYGLYASQVLEQAAVELQDDDYFDVVSDDGDDSQASSHLAMSSHSNQADFEDVQFLDRRTVKAKKNGLDFADLTTGKVDQYRPERVASPLRNEATVRVFTHFVFSTAPFLSCYERPIAVSMPPQTAPNPSAPLNPMQNLWTSTLPIRALDHQGLLHAMLAMSSLHIARLNKASVTPSYKHYAWSIKKIHNQVAKRDGRHRVEVLAATLLLSFFEVMSASMHQWLPHLGGAGQLLAEIDFAGLARTIHQRKARAEERPQDSLDTVAYKFAMIDHRVLDLVSGIERPVDTLGYPIEEREARSCPSYTNNQPQHLELFATFQDLFWWYLKCDVIFSILSGDFTLMPFNRWIRCPPRSNLGEPSQVFGNFDWIILLLGRVCTFAASDRQRKIRHNELTGYRHARMPFHGLAPSVSRSCPTVYGTPISGDPSPAHDILNVDDLKMATEGAIKEWNAIEKATSLVEVRLVTAFPRAAPASLAGTTCPFGQVISYGKDSIGLLMLHLRLARLILLRSHPYMPPSMVQAIPAAASQTAQLAQEMGQIVCGITSNLSSAAALNPAVAGACADVTIPMYAAGMQYKDDTQRSWLLKRLRDLEAQSGNASVGLCCLGLERFWKKAPP